MFCPKCGKEIGEEQVFCRYCGGELSAETPENKSNWTNRIGMFSLGASLFFVCCLALLFFLRALGGSGLREGFVILFLLISGVIFSGIISLLLAENRKLQKSRKEKKMPKPLEASQDSVKLLEEKEFDPVWTSVIENTTKNLVSNKRRTTNELR